MSQARPTGIGRFARRALWMGLVILGSPTPSSALDPDRAITQYVRETWTVKDGAPAGTITGITQSPDGYLLLGTEGEALVRFDGVSFVRRRTSIARSGARSIA